MSLLTKCCKGLLSVFALIIGFTGVVICFLGFGLVQAAEELDRIA